MGLTILLVAIGVFVAYRRYVQDDVPQTAPVGSFATRAARRDLFQDDVNEAVLMRPGQQLTHGLVVTDDKGVDGAVGGIATLIGTSSARLRRVQTGFVRSYALTMLGGVVAVVAALAVVVR
ncbi:MAG TPA: NADH-quinone oxidoreductase subunit L, partial [Actinomycetales bacterium]|jgi:NADH-quinone oxidoreductase subunit L